MAGLEIERLTLHLSGLSEGEGRHLARLIADGLASAPLPESAGSRSSMSSQITARTGDDVQELSQQILADLLRQLQRSL